MVIRAANPNETEKVIQFYYEIIDRIDKASYYLKWIKGVYPSDEYLTESVLKQQMIIALDEDKIIGAMIINQDCNESYSTVKWESGASENESMVIHTLCVLPEYRKKGCGKQLVDFAIKHAEENSLKAIHLDVIDGNVPAAKLYESMGFKRLESIQMYYASTGWTSFTMYEYCL